MHERVWRIDEEVVSEDVEIVQWKDCEVVHVVIMGLIFGYISSLQLVLVNWEWDSRGEFSPRSRGLRSEK